MFNRFPFATLIIFSACNNNSKIPVSKETSNNPEIIIGDTVTNFFPVTSYLRGEIFGIKTGGITPVK